MEKFALLDFLKVFESLSGKRPDEPTKEKPAENAQAPAAAPTPAARQQPETYETNVMANVISRHEEISNRIRNKK